MLEYFMVKNSITLVEMFSVKRKRGNKTISVERKNGNKMRGNIKRHNRQELSCLIQRETHSKSLHMFPPIKCEQFDEVQLQEQIIKRTRQKHYFTITINLFCNTCHCGQ